MSHEQPGLPEGVYYGIAIALRQSFREVRTVYEVGCGTFRLTKHLCGVFSSVGGCDPSTYPGREGLKSPYRENEVEEHPGVESLSRFDHCGIEAVQAAPRSYDLLLSWQALEHLRETSLSRAVKVMGAMAEIWQVHSICLAPPESPERFDPTHALLRSRAWWLDRFAETGWVLDGKREKVLLAAGNWQWNPELFVLRRHRDWAIR